MVFLRYVELHGGVFMSEIIVPNVPSNEVTAPSAKDPTTAGSVASSNAPITDVNSSTKINSLSELRERAPKIWNAMMMGIAQRICSESKHHSDHLKQIMRESRNS